MENGKIEIAVSVSPTTAQPFIELVVVELFELAGCCSQCYTLCINRIHNECMKSVPSQLQRAAGQRCVGNPRSEHPACRTARLRQFNVFFMQGSRYIMPCMLQWNLSKVRDVLSPPFLMARLMR